MKSFIPSPSLLTRRELLLPGLAAAASLVLPRGLAQAATASDAPLFEGIMQISYIVPDLQQAMRDYTERLGIGPWFVTEHFNPPGMLYRGEPTSPDVAIGMTYSDHMNVELIQQRDDTPSVYRETLAKKGYGFHHWGLASDYFDRDLAAYRDRGEAVAFEVTLGGGNRIAYIDTTATLPGMIELIEVTDGVRSGFGNMYRISRDWDGRDLIYQG